MSRELPPALRSLLEVGAALVRGSGTGRLLLARSAGLGVPGAEPALARARAEASEPLPAKLVERRLREAWQRAPARVLEDLDLSDPVAVTPLAQVHRGALEGESVAVKVRRPGLEAAVRSDLGLLDGIRLPLAAAFPRLDAVGLLAQVRERALDELDFEHEAAQQRAVGRALRRTAGVVIPATHTELAAPAVLVSGWLEGPTLADRRPGDPSAVARALVAAHVQAAHAGLLLCDPRPNHVVLLAGDGAIGLLGTGAAAHGDRSRFARQLDALAAPRDGDELLRALLGELLTGSSVLDHEALVRVGERTWERLDEVLALAGRMRPEPADLWLARGLAQLLAVLAGLGVSEDWAALVAEAGRRG